MKLQAGKLTMLYEDGFLRYIAAGEDEVLRMIYFAVRGKDWNTVPSAISNEKISKTTSSFTISYDRLFSKGDINMLWQVQIEGFDDSTIHFTIRGKALTSFHKNRSGFCVLHPIKECAGNKVAITHPDGTAEKNIFPAHISPHQPFKDITEMEWDVAGQYTARIQFEGDIFETEDQRNWTDNSYKTYCTPLALPFPVAMHQGEKVHQHIRVSLEGNCNTRQKEDGSIKISYNEKDVIAIPPIGICRASLRNENYLQGLKKLSAAGFSHYRVDVRLSDDSWPQTLKEILDEKRHLKVPLEIGLFVPSNNDIAIEKFINCDLQESDIKSIILLQQDKKCISNQLLKKVLPLIKKQFPNTLTGGGTANNFAELNRSDIAPAGLDFVSYAIHPQVHAFDDKTLIENTAAQSYTVHSGKHKYKIPVHISPVILHDKTDARQQTPFGAAWTLASLKYLIEAGATSITYFEAIGERGIANYETVFTPFPLKQIFDELLSKKWTHIIPSNTNKPLAATCLILANKNQKKIITIDHTKQNNGFNIIEEGTVRT